MSKGMSTGLLLLAAMIAPVSCAGSSLQPEPSLAMSLEAQASFQGIRERWVLSKGSERAELEPRLEAFRARFPTDPLARMADAYLAFLALEKGDVKRARALAERVRRGPIGNTRDLGTLIDGASLVREGKPEEALQQLDPLVGKMLDTYTHDLLHGAVVAAAVDAGRWYQAIIYMNEWIRGAAEEDLPVLRERLTGLLETFPPNSLESALRAMGAAHQADIWERELRDILAIRLAGIAMERSDPELARSVLETSRTVVGIGEKGAALAQLATSAGRAHRIIDARVGWVVATGDRYRTGRSTQAMSGALEVFRPSRSVSAVPGQPLVQPVLITRAISAEESVKEALDDLAYRGAAVLVGGYDSAQASELAAFGEAESVAVVLLVAPEVMPVGAKFTFVAGVGEPRWSEFLPDQAASQVEKDRSVRVGVGEAPEHPMAYSCERAANLDSAFPVAAWREAGVEAVAVDGPGWCARSLLEDLQRARFSPVVWLGLEAREAARPFGGEIRVASCGKLGSKGAEETLRAWRAATGQDPAWFEALGRDVAKLVHDAVAPLPRNTSLRLEEVSRRRVLVQQNLAQVEAPLWTTEARGFAGGRTLPRKIQYVPHPRN